MNYLKNERERLGFTASEVYEEIDAGRSTYARWEAGSPIPSDKLNELLKMGFDIQYVVSGVRASGTTTKQQLDLMHEAYDWVLKFADMIDRKQQLTGEIAKPVAEVIYSILAEDDEDGPHELSATTAMEITASMRNAMSEM